jgi:hypothetical protein
VYFSEQTTDPPKRESFRLIYDEYLMALPSRGNRESGETGTAQVNQFGQRELHLALFSPSLLLTVVNRLYDHVIHAGRQPNARGDRQRVSE